MQAATLAIMAPVSPPDAGPTGTVEVAGVAAGVPGLRATNATVVDRRDTVYDPFLAGRRVELVTGSASLVRGRVAPWQAIVKTTTGPGLRDARRELAAYRLGIAAPSIAGRLGAPRLLGSRDSDDAVEIWLEVLRDLHDGAWPLDRFRLAARAIARWNAQWID